MHTPWGQSDSQKTIAPGIVQVSTPSHGGYRVSFPQVQQMPEALRDFAPFAGPGWYEEDEDWAIVVLAFPTLFSPGEVFSAVRTARLGSLRETFHDNDLDKSRLAWARVVAWLLGTGDGRIRLNIADAYAKGHAAEWEVGSLWSLPDKPRAWGASFTRLGDAARRSVILPAYPSKRWYSTEELDALPPA